MGTGRRFVLHHDRGLSTFRHHLACGRCIQSLAMTRGPCVVLSAGHANAKFLTLSSTAISGSMARVNPARPKYMPKPHIGGPMYIHSAGRQ